MLKTLGGRCIYKTQNQIQVHQNLFYRWLTLGSNELHTLISRRHPEKPGLDYIHQLSFAVRTQPAECCLLGLGGAGIVHALAPYLGSAQLHAIENNTDIIEIAQKYFMIDRLKNLRVIHQDASLFVKECKNRYQHLMVDLFDAHSFPTQCSTPDFFEDCRRLLLNEGIFALNLTNIQEQWSLFSHVRTIFFDRTVSLPVKGAANMIVLACNGLSIAPLIELLKESGCLKKLSWEPRWGCVAEI